MCSIRRHLMLHSLQTYWRPIWCRHATVEQLEVTPASFWPKFNQFQITLFHLMFEEIWLLLYKSIWKKRLTESYLNQEMSWKSLRGADFTRSAARCRTRRGRSFLWMWSRRALLYLLTGDRPHIDREMHTCVHSYIQTGAFCVPNIWSKTKLLQTNTVRVTMNTFVWIIIR